MDFTVSRTFWGNGSTLRCPDCHRNRVPAEKRRDKKKDDGSVAWWEVPDAIVNHVHRRPY